MYKRREYRRKDAEVYLTSCKKDKNGRQSNLLQKFKTFEKHVTPLKKN